MPGYCPTTSPAGWAVVDAPGPPDAFPAPGLPATGEVPSAETGSSCLDTAGWDGPTGVQGDPAPAGSALAANDPVPNPPDAGDVAVIGSVPAAVGLDGVPAGVVVGGVPVGGVVVPGGVAVGGVPGAVVTVGTSAGVVTVGRFAGAVAGGVPGAVATGVVPGAVVTGGASAGVVVGAVSEGAVVGGVLPDGVVSLDGLAAADPLPDALTADAADTTARGFACAAPSAVATATACAGGATEAFQASITARAKTKPMATVPSIRR
jgi:hypothetical protein